MKMRKSEHFVRSSSSISGNVFNVKMTDKLFETLFSSLYRYKEAAALRETVCNAIDAHNMRNRLQRWMPSHYASLSPMPQLYSKYLAPSNIPVEVHLPDDYEPWLEIKDWGIGLSLEQIMGEPILAREDEVLLAGNMVVKEDEIPEGSEVLGVPDFSSYYGGQLVFKTQDGEIIRSPGLYTTLFNSTKEDDDGQIGAFGLGSKSPFSVSDSFTVESRYEGKIYRFLMYLNGNRIPTVDLVTKNVETREPAPEDTDEWNGLSVKVPVKNSRFRAFEEELIRLGKVMNPNERPKVTNHSYNFDWEDISFNNRVGNTYIQPKGTGNTHYAVMGGVSYPIDLEQLEQDVSSILEKFPTSYTFFELGELNVPPSREDLSYDEYTRETLNRQFKKVANKIMQEKISELNLAASKGPLALYMKKDEFTNMFGSGFRKMMERDFPADTRFYKGKYVYNGTPDIERNIDVDAPFRTAGNPYYLEIYWDAGYWETKDSLMLNDVYGWVGEKKSVAIIIDNSSRARNLKIRTARNNHDVVIVVKPNDSLLTNRNLLQNHKGAYKNHEELQSYFESWVGKQETTIDHLVFADKFYEVISEILVPSEVYFMHDMQYVKPPVEKDPGMFEYEGFRFSFYKDRELSAEDISSIIDSGKQIVYIEISGTNSIHDIRGKRVNEYVARSILECMHNTPMDDEGNKIFEFMNFHKKVILARRKSVPMMKKFPEVFVPIDAVFEMLLKRHMPYFKSKNARELLALRKQTRCIINRIPYAESLLAKSHEGIPEKFAYLKDRISQLDKNNIELIPETEWDYLKEISKNKKGLPGVKDLNEAMEKLNFHVSIKKNFDQYRHGQARMIQLFSSINELLKNNGYCEISWTRSISQTQKKYNRYRVDCHNLLKHLMATYTPVAQNPIEEDKEGFFAAISKRILGA